MEIQIRVENGRVPVTIVSPSGDLDASNFIEFQQKADELIQAGARYILIDLAGVPYISSAGFRAIQHVHNQLRALHPDANLTDEQVRKGISAGSYTSPHLKLLNLSGESQKTFAMTGFDMFIDSYTDLEKAVAAF